MNRTYRTAQILTAAYLLTALALSFAHIAALFQLMGSGAEAWIAPLMIDTVAVIGKLSMSTAFTPKTRAAGKRALIFAGTVSLVANVTVGFVHQQYGSALLGLIVVTGALWAENHLHHLRPTTKRGPRKATARKAPAARKPRTTKATDRRPTPAVAALS